MRLSTFFNLGKRIRANLLGNLKPPRKSKSSRKRKNEKPLIQCHECKGFGHMRIECPSYPMKEKTKESKDNGLVATWSDIENDFLMNMWMNVVTLWPLLPQPIRWLWKVLVTIKSKKIKMLYIWLEACILGDVGVIGCTFKVIVPIKQLWLCVS